MSPFLPITLRVPPCTVLRLRGKIWNFCWSGQSLDLGNANRDRTYHPWTVAVIRLPTLLWQERWRRKGRWYEKLKEKMNEAWTGKLHFVSTVEISSPFITSRFHMVRQLLDGWVRALNVYANQKPTNCAKLCNHLCLSTCSWTPWAAVLLRMFAVWIRFNIFMDHILTGFRYISLQ